MSKWVQFSRRFNFQPAKQSAVTVQHGANTIASVTDELAASAIKNGAGIEIEAPANAEEAAAMKAGTVAVRPVKVDAPAEESNKAPAGGGRAAAASKPSA